MVRNIWFSILSGVQWICNMLFLCLDIPEDCASHPLYPLLLVIRCISNQWQDASYTSSFPNSSLVVFNAAESFLEQAGTHFRCAFRSRHEDLFVYVTHVIQSRCKWSLSCTVMVIQLDHPSVFLFFFSPAFSLNDYSHNGRE